MPPHHLDEGLTDFVLFYVTRPLLGRLTSYAGLSTGKTVGQVWKLIWASQSECKNSCNARAEIIIFRREIEHWFHLVA